VSEVVGRSAWGTAGTPADPTRAGLYLRVLGALVATRDGATVDLGGRRQRAVLAALVVARGHVVSADRLIDAVWGDEAPRDPAGALQAYVSHLRRSLEPERTARHRTSVIVREGQGYACRLPDDAVDAWRFERLVREGTVASDPSATVAALEAALALWRGPAYADHSGERWADAESARLAELRAVAHERLFGARLATGQAAVLVPELEALAAEEPLREERWRLLALALYRSQRQADALAALRQARAVLADELGVDPGPALRALEAEILSQSPALDAPAPAPAAPSAVPAPPGNLVDRDRELAEIRSCLGDALDGQGRVALIEGPAGIGKTSLLAQARRLAEARGALTLSARGSQLEKAFGFGVVRQLFEPVLVDPSQRERLLAGAASSARSVFDAQDSVERADGSFAALHGLYWLTVNLSGDHPLVLAVDDLQWCDAGSLRFLGYLVRRLEGLRVLIAATLRTGEPFDDAALLADLAHDFVTTPVRPGLLTPAGVAALVRARLGDADDAFVAACHRTTTGNPLLLRQLLRALEAEGVRPDASHADTVTAIGSRAVSSIVLMRLARLSPSATGVARAIAVLGDGAGLPAVAELAGLPEPEAALALAALARAEVVRDEPPVGFVHPLVRDAVYRDLPPGERELHHERAARALDHAGAAAEQVAAHLLQVPSRRDPWVVDVLRRAASTAAARGASDSAATYLTRALAEPPADQDRGRVLLELGEMEAQNDGRAAALHLREAYRVLDDHALRASVAMLLIHVLLFAGERGEATEFARAAVAALPAELDDARQGLVALLRTTGFMHRLDESIWRGGSADIRGDGIGARMLATQQAWERVIDAEDPDGAVALARFALADGILLRADPGLFWVVAAFVLDMAEVGLGSFWDDALAEAHARGSLFRALSTHLWRAHKQWWDGDLREAEQSLVTASEQSERWGASAIAAPYGEAFLLEVLLDRGDAARARAYVDAFQDRPRVGDGALLYAEARARLLIVEGRPTEALTLLDSLSVLQAGIRNPMWHPWRSLRAQALALLGRRDEAIALVEEDLAILRPWRAPRPIGIALRLLGELRSDEPTLREAVAVLTGSTARFELARALWALARAVADQAEAVDLLDRARELAEACGADGLRAEVVAALTAAGVAVPARPEGAAALTTTERRIATMAVGGADLNVIAQELFLTPRSVDVALTSVYRQLRVETLDDLRAALVR
jgi:DNA-binding SARP family transcriptional activator/DNA-binding NarL/FixJ family response regulator